MARRRLTVFHFADIVARMRDGETRRNIQAALGVSPKTITTIRTVATLRGWLDPGATVPEAGDVDAAVREFNARKAEEQGKASPQTSLVEPYRDVVTKWAREGIDAQTIWAALVRNHSFNGSYSCVRRFVRRLVASLPDPAVRLQFPPGDMAQVDFGSGPALLDSDSGKMRKTHIFVMTLAYSRHQYAEIVWNQSVATWLRCHRNAFEFFGGVPHRVRVDNCKCAITRACRYDPQVQRSYGEFALACGFRIDPCIVETPEHKGRVESGVKYVKKSFVKSPRTLTTLGNSNQQLLEWVLGEAGNRVHGTTHEVPLRVFAEEEKAALKPLPVEGAEVAVWSTVKLHPDCHVIFDRSYYSAPYRYIGQELDLRATDSCVMLFEQAQLIAFHTRATRPGQWKTNLDHYPPEKVAYLQQTPQWCLEEALKVGEACCEFMTELLGDRVTVRLRAAQGTLRLRKRFGAKRLEAACCRALAFDRIEYRALKRILEGGLDMLPLHQGEGGQLELPFIETPRFARDIADMFRSN